MDGITFLDASLIYSLLFSPLLTMVLLLFWTSANMKNTAKVQLLGIVILLVLGFFAINSPLIVIIEAAAIILLVVWISVYRDFFREGQLSISLLIIALQVAYCILFFVVVGLESTLVITLLCIIPVLSMILLYPWTFGSKNTSNGKIFIIIAFNIQVIIVILNIVFSLTAMFNL